MIVRSLPGLVATRLMQLSYKSKESVVGLILLAPAFNFYDVLESRTKPEEWIGWQKQGFMLVNHPVWKSETKLSWEFVKDLKQNHTNMDIPIKVPILLIHGDTDTEIHIEIIKHFATNQQSLGTIIDEYYLREENHNLLNKFDLVIPNIVVWLNKNGFIN